MSLLIRDIKFEDCEIISDAFKAQNWYKPIEQFEKYVSFQNSGERDIIVATINNEFAGYLTINWESNYSKFKEEKIPEIVDFNVLEKFQRKGIGTSLMNEAEKRIKTKSKKAGIGFGITKDYGKAHILYIKRNYIPDGNGVIINSAPLVNGEKITINDSVVMHLTKIL